MHERPTLRRSAAAALAATTFLVMSSVGSCQMPQPKIPSLGAAEPARASVAPGHGPLSDVKAAAAVGAVAAVPITLP